MSYDLAFWADTRPNRPQPQEIYEALLNGANVAGLGEFNTRAALEALGERFPCLTPPPTGPSGETAWESPDSSTVIEFMWSPQHVIAMCRGRVTNDQMNEIIDICITTGGGRLYDPQTGERFDSQ